jgi:hypothetical protein
MVNFLDQNSNAGKIISDDPYGPDWDGDLNAATKNAIYDEMETRVTQTDPILDGTITGTAFLDEDDMTSDSATKVASQQSIKAYVDNNVFPATITSAADDQHLIYDTTEFVNVSYYHPIVVSLADGATINTDASQGNIFKVTIAGNRTIAAPTNAKEGQFIQYRIAQDATGTRTITWNAIFDFGGAGEPTLTTTGSRTDYVSFRYNDDNDKWDYMGAALNYGG